MTPLTPNFQMIQPLNISQEVLATWAKTAAMILSNPVTPESSAALTALGDQLAAHQWTEAAHAWYVVCIHTNRIQLLTPRQLPALATDLADRRSWW